MDTRIVCGIGVAFGLLAGSVFGVLYLWPQLRQRSAADALRPLLVMHAFRFIGMSFLVPGVVSPDLPSRFAHSAAWGDLLAALLAPLSWCRCCWCPTC